MPNAINTLALGTCACARFSPNVLVFFAHRPIPDHRPKKSRRRYFCAPHTNIILTPASPPRILSFHLLHLFLPLSLSPHTRANSHPRCQRQVTRPCSSSSSHLFYSRYYWDSVLSDSSSTKLKPNQQNFERGLPDLRTDSTTDNTTDDRQSKRLLSQAFSVLGRWTQGTLCSITQARTVRLRSIFRNLASQPNAPSLPPPTNAPSFTRPPQSTKKNDSQAHQPDTRRAFN